MTRTYNELVGILVTFPKVAQQYRMDYIYRELRGDTWGKWKTQYGMDFPLVMRRKDIIDGLGDAYAPVIEGVWRCDDYLARQVYFQLNRRFIPPVPGIDGQFKLFAEW